MGKQATMEIDGSLDELMRRIRSAFDSQFANDDNGFRYWLRDIYEDHVIAQDDEDGQLYRVAMSMDMEGEEIEFADQSEWEPVRLTYTTEMVSDQILTEFKGSFPEIAPRAGVDMEGLTEGDDKPFFLTLEVSRVGRVSKNGLLHDEELSTSIMEQINAQASTGNMGHIKESERSTAYPVSDVHWLGAARQGDSIWAKGYIPKTAPAQREHFRILMKTGGKAATSITGPAIREFVDKKAGIWRAKNFELEQLDLAPYNRAALPPESDFVVTSEQNQRHDRYERMEQPTMTKTKAELIAELNVEDLPDELRQAVIEAHQQDAGQKQAIEQKDAQIAELQKTVAEYRTQEFESALESTIAEYLNWQVEDEANKAKVQILRQQLKTGILAKLGDERTPAKIQEAAKAAWEEIQPLAETVQQAMMGPGAVINEAQKGTRKIEDTPEARKEAASNFSF